MNLFTTVLQSAREDDMWHSLSGGNMTHLFLNSHIPALDIAGILRRIRENHPAVKLVIVTSAKNILVTQRMLNGGAKALISKFTGIAELVVCLRTIDIGRKYISPDIRALLKEQANILHPVNFTYKEVQVLQYIANGYTTIRTAELLKVSKHTIIAHRRNMMEKSGAGSAAGLVKFGMEAGLIMI